MNNPTALYRLWAKTNETEDDYTPACWRRHPLPLHLIDVGHVAEVWLDVDPLLLNRFGELLPSASREDIRQTLVLTTALHDLGKVHPLFQAKSEQGWADGYATLQSRPRPDGTGFDHGAASAAILQCLMKDRLLPRSYKTVRRLIYAAAGHHGTLYEKEVIDNIAPITTEQRQLALALVEEMEHHFSAMPALPTKPGNDFCMLAAGFVSVCDWLGSDSHSFPFAPDVASRADADGYLSQLRSSGDAEAALRKSGLVAAFRDDLPDFAVFHGFDTLKPLQQAAEAVPFGEAAGPEIVIVEEMMGGGKTEIAQYLAARALAAGTAAGLYFALPTQASSNALFGRTQRFTERMAVGPVSLALAHGARQFFEAFRALLRTSRHVPMGRTTRERQSLDDEPAPPSEVVATAWLRPARKALLAPIGLGTIDQAMLGALSVRHAFVRLFALGRKVVVLDEVHAYDAYMNGVILHLLRWLRVLGAKVILLSATLPDGLRRELLATFDVTEPDYHTPYAPYAPYPQILHGSAGEAARRFVPPATADPKKPGSRHPVEVECIKTDDPTARGVELVAELASGDGCVAWIRNTVREAQEAYRQLLERGNADVVLLHARFTRADRNAIEEDLVARLGPAPDDDHPRPRRLIVVATQVIEQSVDLDFDAMVTDLAPGDLLLQRAGRLHRHDRAPETRHGHTTPRLFVLLPGDEDRRLLRYGLSAYVYDPETLARTAALLQEPRFTSWVLSRVCRALVSELYDRGEDHWTAQRLDGDAVRLEAVRGRARRLRNKMERAARTGLMPAPEAGLLSMRQARRDASDDGASVHLTTRYGGHSATVSLFHHTGGTVEPLRRSAQIPGPDAGYPDRLDVEEAFALSSVSFPWYDTFPEPAPDDGLADWAVWWQQHHRYDARLFALVHPDDTFVLPEADLHGRYTFREGLVIDRADRELPTDPSGYADRPPYEAL